MAMSIMRCTNKDSLGRQCIQYRFKDQSHFCGVERGELCAHLATNFIYEKEQSEETKQWIERHA